MWNSTDRSPTVWGPLLSLFVMSTLCMLHSPVLAQTSDEVVLGRLFDEETLADNFLSFLTRIDSQPADVRQKLLAEWVLPGEHHGFRMQGAFQYADGQPESPGCETLVSPVFELIKATKTAEQRSVLQERLAQKSVHSLRDRRCKLALVCLLQLSDENHDAVRTSIDQLLSLAVEDDLSLPESRWPDVLVAWEGLQHPDLHALLSDYFIAIYRNLNGFHDDLVLDVQEDYLRGLSMRQQPTPAPEGVTNTEWLPAQFMDSLTHGRRRPISDWRVEQDQLNKVSGHEVDYLLYSLPLRGDYAIECDLSRGSGLQAGLQAGGVYVEAVDSGARLQVGNFRKYDEFLKLEPSLWIENSTIHHRAEVRDGVLSHFISGRLVLRQPLHPDYSPWVGVRSWRRNMITGTDMRITGSPVVPDAVDLSADPALASWAPYYEGGFGRGRGNWWAEELPTTEIRGNIRPEVAGSHLEKLLRYQRPVWEDGQIEYEFYYDPGKMLVHPCIGRVVFLLGEGGVQLHRVTDRVNEFTDADPANAEPLSDTSVPLRAGDWNQLKLSFEGARISCSVNGQRVCDYEMPSSIERTFGLFHYADLSAVRVRNVIWHGGWSREVPNVVDQILANHLVEELDQHRSELAATYHHSFAEGLPRDVFNVSGDESVMQQLPEGLRVTRARQQGMEDIRCSLGLHGDYDVVIGFQDLVIENQGQERTGIGLQTWLGDFTDECNSLYRREQEKNGRRHAAFVHKSRQPDGSYAHQWTHAGEEATFGRLRLVRRDGTILALMAEGDSPNYRLISQHVCGTADVIPDGLRLLSEAHQNQLCSVTWTQLDIWAEQIFNWPVQDSPRIVQQLNAGRAKFPLEEIDFHQELEGSRYPLVKPERGVAVSQTAEGLLMELPQDELRARSDIRLPSRPLVEFDTTVHLDVLKLEGDNDPHQRNEVVLQCRLTNFVTEDRSSYPDDENPVLEATLILREKQLGVRLLVVRTVEGRRGGGLNYRVLRAVPVKSPDSLRIALHDHVLYYLYSEADSDDEVVLAMRPVDNRCIGAGPVLTAIAANGHPTSVVWRSLQQYSRVLDLGVNIESVEQ